MINLTALWGNKNAAGLELIKNDRPDQKGDNLLLIGGNIVGRLWKGQKKDKNGNDYLSGFFFDARCLVFKNDQKGNDKAPTYRVLIAEPNKEDQQPEPKEVSQPVITGEDDDLPF